MNRATVITVFASSPSDVAPERQALLRAIERINRLNYIRKQYVIRPFLYEEIAPLAGQDAQAIVDRACSVKDCYLVICILWCRMDTPFLHPITNQNYISGTEYEFVTAYQEYLAHGQPYIFLYRKTNQPVSAEQTSDMDQMDLVETFFSKFQEKSGAFKGLFAPFKEWD